MCIYQLLNSYEALGDVEMRTIYPANKQGTILLLSLCDCYFVGLFATNLILVIKLIKKTNIIDAQNVTLVDGTHY